TKQEESRPEELAPDLENVVVDLTDPVEVRDEDPSELGDHPVEALSDRGLDFSEGRRDRAEHGLIDSGIRTGSGWQANSVCKQCQNGSTQPGETLESPGRLSPASAPAIAETSCVASAGSRPLCTVSSPSLSRVRPTSW